MNEINWSEREVVHSPHCLPQVEVGCSLFPEDEILPKPESSSALPDNLSCGFQACLTSPHDHISQFLVTNLFCSDSLLEPWLIHSDEEKGEARKDKMLCLEK